MPLFSQRTEFPLVGLGSSSTAVENTAFLPTCPSVHRWFMKCLSDLSRLKYLASPPSIPRKSSPLCSQLGESRQREGVTASLTFLHLDMVSTSPLPTRCLRGSAADAHRFPSRLLSRVWGQRYLASKTDEGELGSSRLQLR